MNYENLFKKTLLKEQDDALNMSPDMDPNAGGAPEGAEPVVSDEDAWSQSNPDITDNQDLSSKFDVAGLDKAEIEKYSEVIAQWGQGIESAITQLAQIVKFAASETLSEAPGSEQFSSLIKDAPRLKSDLSAFRSQVEDLAETVKLSINDAAKERKNKINSLNN
jgi:hypothetical protein